MKLQDMGTGEVWLHVQRELRAQALGCVQIGASAEQEATLYDLVNAAMSMAYAALQAAQEGLTDPTRVLQAAFAQLVEAYHAAILAGFQATAEGIAVLAERVGDAIRSVGQGWTSVFHAFLGATPAQVATGVAVLLGVGVVGAAVVLSGAGGQAALVHLAQRQVMI